MRSLLVCMLIGILKITSMGRIDRIGEDGDDAFAGYLSCSSCPSMFESIYVASVDRLPKPLRLDSDLVSGKGFSETSTFLRRVFCVSLVYSH